VKSPIAALWATGRGGYSNGTDVFEELMPSPHRTSRRLLRVTAGLMTLALTVTACSSGEDSPEGGQSAERTASAEETLAGVCPNPIVIQTDWTPQAEYGAVYRLLGDDIEVDAERGSVSFAHVAISLNSRRGCGARRRPSVSKTSSAPT